MHEPSGLKIFGFVLSFLVGYFVVLILLTTFLPVHESWKFLEPHDWELKGIVGVASVIALFVGGAIGGMARVQSITFGGGENPLHIFSSFLAGFAASYIICFIIGAKALGIDDEFKREVVLLGAIVSPIGGMISNGLFTVINQMQER